MNTDLKLYTYRYMWKIKNSDKIALKVITDTIQMHEAFMEKLISSEEVVSAAREYMHEIDLQFISVLNTFKEEKDEKV